MQTPSPSRAIPGVSGTTCSAVNQWQQTQMGTDQVADAGLFSYLICCSDGGDAAGGALRKVRGKGEVLISLFSQAWLSEPQPQPPPVLTKPLEDPLLTSSPCAQQ